MDFFRRREVPKTNMFMIVMAVLTVIMTIALSGYIFRWHSVFKSGFPGATCTTSSDCLDGLTCKSDGTCGC